MNPKDDPASQLIDVFAALQNHVKQAQRRQAVNPATLDKSRAAKPSRFEVLMKKWSAFDAWKLKTEACALALGLNPAAAYDLTLFDPDEARRNELFLRAERSVEAGMLDVVNRDAQPHEWSVRPAEFVGWLGRGEWKGADATQSLLQSKYPPPTQPLYDERAARRERILRSGYSTTALDIALHAIDALWLPYIEGKTGASLPKREAVSAWMAKEYPVEARSKNLVDHIDALIRSDDRKTGGNLPSKGLPKKPNKKQGVRRHETKG